MRYRTKIYFSFLAVSTLSVFGGLGFLYFKSSESLRSSLNAKVIAVAATAAALINVDDVKDLSISLDSNSPAFQKLQKQLLIARDNNRRGDLFVKYIYLLKPEKPEARDIIFLIEAQNAVNPGQKDEQQDQSQIGEHLNEFYSPKHFITDKFGVWMSGFAPIVDEKGDYVATLGVDISATSVNKSLHKIIGYAMAGLAMSLILAYALAYYLAHKMTDALDEVSLCLDQVATGDYNTTISIESDDEFGTLAKSMNHMIRGLKERKALKSSFSRYVSTYVMDQILNDQTLMNLSGERKKITVLFSDIRQFTQISENMTPESVVALLNEYFDVMLKVIFKHQGTVDKFMGDGIMAEFGAPLSDNEQEVHAVRCGLEMLEELKKLNDHFLSQDRPTFNIGIGIHTGYAIMGNIGTETRMEYTAIGDCVNVASRLEQATKTYNFPLLISEDTYNALNNQFPGQFIGSIPLPGRSREINVYAITV